MKSKLVFLIFVMTVLAFSVGNPGVVAAPEDLGSPAKDQVNIKVHWDQKYIDDVPPIMMLEPYLFMFGQVDEAIPYTYEDVVKLSGHSCGATAGAFVIARKALDELYPGDEIPVRGQIKVYVPGAEDQWNLGVFGEAITYITGAAPKTGFNGSEFGQVNDLYVRQNKMIYTDLPTPTQPPMMKWIFERTDTGKRVSVQYKINLIQPPATPYWTELGKKMALGSATPEEASAYIEYWNARAVFVFENADTLNGFFVVEPLN